MNFTEGPKQPYMPAYIQLIDPRISYAISNRDIGLLFGQRIKPSMLWRLQTTVKNELVLCDDQDVFHLLGVIANIQRLSFTFDNFSYPLVTVQLEDRIQVYRFNNYGGDVGDKELLLDLLNCRNPHLIPSNVSDLGSITNQPYLVYVDALGNVLKRSYKDGFGTVIDQPIKTGLISTDELRQVGITRTGKIQIEISKLKQTP